MIIAIIGQKGGAGKTTVAVNIASELHRSNQRVLLVDADPQGSVTAWAETALDVGHETPSVVAMGKGMHKHLPKMATDYDHVVVDTPGRLGPITRSALAVCDVAVVVCRPTTVDLNALGHTIELIDEASSTLTRELAVCLLISQADERRVTARAVIQNLRTDDSEEALWVLDSVLGARADFQDAMVTGQGVTSFAPRGKAAREVRALVHELLSMEEEDA